MIWVNGIPGNHIDAQDRGVQYGDGLFETMAVHEGLIPLWERHLARLREGCGRLSIPMPAVDQLQAEVTQASAGVVRGVLKLVVTRGASGRGYRPPAHAEPTRIVSRHPWPDYPAAYATEGVSLRWCETRLAIQPRLAGLKHLNRLEQVLARAEWDDPAIPEGLMLDSAGAVVEGTMTNLFCVREGRLFTPDLSGSGVAGIMRGWVLDWARTQDIAAHVTRVEPQMVESADEIFVCNSVIGLWPARALAGRDYPPGMLTRRVLMAWAQMLNGR